MKLSSVFVNWKKSLIVFGVGVLISLIYLIVNGFDLMINYCDAFFISGFVITSIGVLSVLSYLGAFDTIGYSFYALGRVFTSKKELDEKKYNDLVDYVEKKKSKRGKLKEFFLPYIYSGVFYILLAVILFFFV